MLRIVISRLLSVRNHVRIYSWPNPRASNDATQLRSNTSTFHKWSLHARRCSAHLDSGSILTFATNSYSRTREIRPGSNDFLWSCNQHGNSRCVCGSFCLHEHPFSHHEPTQAITVVGEEIAANKEETTHSKSNKNMVHQFET